MLRLDFFLFYFYNIAWFRDGEDIRPEAKSLDLRLKFGDNKARHKPSVPIQRFDNFGLRSGEHPSLSGLCLTLTGPCPFFVVYVVCIQPLTPTPPKKNLNLPP